MVDVLVKHGADVNVQNDKGETSLHYAIRLKRRDLIRCTDEDIDTFVETLCVCTHKYTSIKR